MAKHRKSESHVRLYKHELESEAYRSLSPTARALLVEFRALHAGRRDNRVPMSVREMMRRLNVSQRPAERARDELLDRGFIRMLTKGNFTRKVLHASEYCLTHVPLEDKDGATAPKDFMRWRQKNTVAESTTGGSGRRYREPAKNGQKHPHGSGIDYREGQKRPPTGSGIDYTDKLPRSRDFGMSNETADTGREVEHDWL